MGLWFEKSGGKVVGEEEKCLGHASQVSLQVARDSKRLRLLQCERVGVRKTEGCDKGHWLLVHSITPMRAVAQQHAAANN